MLKKLLWIPLLVLAACAQTPRFEVASIKPYRGAGNVSSLRLSNGLFQAENVSLKKLLLNANGIRDDRDYTVDGAGWMGTESFDISARFPPDTPVTQVRQMLQNLLEERFRLKMHRETRQLPIYSLVVARNGPKIHTVAAGQGRTSG